MILHPSLESQTGVADPVSSEMWLRHPASGWTPDEAVRAGHEAGSLVHVVEASKVAEASCLRTTATHTHTGRRGLVLSHLRPLFAFAAFTLLAAGFLKAQDSPGAGSERPAAQREFQVGSPTPRGAWQQSGRAREMHEVARLVIESHEAFDRGDMDTGRAKARAAVQGLQAMERDAAQRGRARIVSRWAEERGRIQLEMLDDPDAAKEAYADAVANDPENPRAVRALQKLLEREQENPNDRRTRASSEPDAPDATVAGL